MKKSEDVKEKIIEAAMGLINKSNGDIAEINTRAIAKRANVGIAQINYHFQTKENLIEICVDRIIKNVVTGFNPPHMPETKPVARLKRTSKLIADFFMRNTAVSRISILSDHKNPKVNDNTVRSTMHLCKTLGDLGISEKKQFILGFTLASVMQTMFLRKEQSNELFGYDMSIKEQRDEVLDLLIETLFGSFDHE